jgi:hypothetical protein
LIKILYNNTRKKLEAFKVQLKAANKGDNVTEEELYQFLKHFHACSNKLLTPSVSVVLIGPVIKAITSFPLVKTAELLKSLQAA